jgi:hypothetical protein
MEQVNLSSLLTSDANAAIEISLRPLRTLLSN